MKNVWCVIRIDTFGNGTIPIFFDKKECAWDYIKEEGEKLLAELGESVIKIDRNKNLAYLGVTTKYTTWAWKAFEANLNLYDENHIPE